MSPSHHSLAIFGIIWELLTILGRFWELLAIFCIFGKFLVTLVTTFDNFCQCLPTFATGKFPWLGFFELGHLGDCKFIHFCSLYSGEWIHEKFRFIRFHLFGDMKLLKFLNVAITNNKILCHLIYLSWIGEYWKDLLRIALHCSTNHTSVQSQSIFLQLLRKLWETRTQFR